MNINVVLGSMIIAGACVLGFVVSTGDSNNISTISTRPVPQAHIYVDCETGVNYFGWYGYQPRLTAEGFVVVDFTGCPENNAN